MKQLAKTTMAAAVALLMTAPALADVTIGVSLPLTGPTSALGIPIKNSIALWPREVAGQKLNVIILDDATDPTNATKNARRFVTDDKVDMLMGSAATPTANAVAAVAAETGTPHLTFAPIDISTSKSPWSYNMPQSTAVMAYAIVAHMKKLGVKTMGFIGYADAYGENWLNDMKKQVGAAGIRIVSEERFARTDTSVTAQALKVTAGNPDANNNPGGKPSVAAQADVDFGPYMADLQRRIKRAWFPPRGQESRRVKVIFQVHSQGELSNLRLEKSSQVAIADQAALAAVSNAAPFRPLPAGAPAVVDIEFTFDYNVFTGGRSF